MKIQTKIKLFCLWMFLNICCSLTLFGQADQFNIYELMDRTDLKLSEVEKIADKHFSEIGTGKGTGYKQYARWLTNRKFQVDEDGYFIPNETLYKNYLSALNTRSSKKSNNNSNTWQKVGWDNIELNNSVGNVGTGRTMSSAVHPSNPNRILVGSERGGIWISDDAGDSWRTPYIKDPTRMRIRDISFAPSDKNIAYASCGEAESGGVLVSADAGDTWDAAYSANGSNQPRRINTLAVHPTNARLLFAAAENGLYYSTNWGYNWTLRKSGVFYDVKFKPNNPSVMYASGKNGFFRSTNEGVNFNPMTDSDFSPASNGNYGVSRIAVTNANPNYVYIVEERGGVMGYLYRSTSSGTNWDIRIDNVSSSGNNYLGSYPGSPNAMAARCIAIAVSATNAEEIYLGGITMYKSVNGGTNFSAFSNQPNGIHDDVNRLKMTNGILYASTDGGLFIPISTQGDWMTKSIGMGIGEVWNMSSSQTNPRRLVVATQDNGAITRLANGKWQLLLSGDGSAAHMHPTDDRLSIAGYNFGSLAGNIVTGSNVSYYPPTSQFHQLPATSLVNAPLAGSEDSPDQVFAGRRGGIWRLDGFGTTVTKISGSSNIPANFHVNDVAVAHTNVNYIYGTTASTLHYTTNGGTSWNSYNFPKSINDIVVSPSDPAKVYVLLGGLGNNAYSYNINTGQLVNISNGIPLLTAKCIAVAHNSNETLYVGMNYGVWKYENSSWQAVSPASLPDVSISDIDIQRSDNRLRVGTYGVGIWELCLQTTCEPLYVGCTDPTLPQPRITGLQPGQNCSNGNNGIRLTFSNLDPNKTYDVYYQTDIELDLWQPASPSGIQISGTKGSWTDCGDFDRDVENVLFYAIHENCDTDSDGLPDMVEILSTKSDPLKADSDSNGVSDGNEDSDCDGYSNSDEYVNPFLGSNPHCDAVCEDEIIISSDPTEEIYSASYVTTVGDVAVNDSNLFRAEGAVILNPGFVAETGSVFCGEIGPCLSVDGNVTASFQAEEEDMENASSLRTVEAPQKVQVEFNSIQNYPNPFNGSTTFEIQLVEDAVVNLKITDLSGQQVTTVLENSSLKKGLNAVKFDAQHLTAGTYFYTILAGEYVESKVMTVIH